MKAPRIRILGWSWLGVVNFLIVQWFFVRIEMYAEASHALPGVTDMRLRLRRWIVPLTGWWSDYKYLAAG